MLKMGDFVPLFLVRFPYNYLRQNERFKLYVIREIVNYLLIIHLLYFTGYVLFIITSFLAGVESTDQCLLNSKVLSCFSGVIMSIISFFLFT